MAADENETEADEEAMDFSQFAGKTAAEILQEGQMVLLMQLVGRCRTGRASHQEMAILRNLLKDNGLTLGIPPEGMRAGEAQGDPMDLPSYDPPEYLRPN